MTMELNLTDELVLIALDDENGKFITDTAHLHYGIAGSILLELALQGRIELKDDYIDLRNSEKTQIPSLDRALEIISNSKKPRSIEHWVTQIGLGAESIKDETIEHLRKANIIRKEAGKILWIIPTTNFPTENPIPENKVRQKLKDIVLNDSPAELKDLMLLSLIEECELTREVFKSKEEYKRAKKRIKNLTKDIEIAKGVDAAIQAIHLAVTTAIMAAVIASTTVTTTNN
jgi:hypothetical protein